MLRNAVETPSNIHNKMLFLLIENHVITSVQVHPIQLFPSVDHWWKGTLGAIAPLGCDISQPSKVLSPADIVKQS